RNRAGPVIVVSSDMSSSEERIGEIQSLFRDVNEQIAEAADRFDVDSARFYCECHDPGCGERLHVPLDEYEQVRAKSTRFVHAPGHVERRFERVVARRRGYAVVEKFGRALTAIVRRLDPRSENA
ncbi:MAG TPA: hypothetical protein VE693_01460, partial [Gaiellaceae bacterium]|nr:hypothetical protein [Gaiellaceae bacterium]